MFVIFSAFMMPGKKFLIVTALNGTMWSTFQLIGALKMENDDENEKKGDSKLITIISTYLFYILSYIFGVTIF